MRLIAPAASARGAPRYSATLTRTPLPGIHTGRRSFSASPTSNDAIAQDDKKKLLIVYHTMTDGTRQMAQAAYEAARKAESPDSPITIQMLKARDAGPEDVLSASGYIFATPENLAAMAGIMKDFFDRTYYAALGKLNGRPYACMICAGSDGENAMRQVDRIAKGWRLKKAADGIIVITHAQTAERCHAMKTIEKPDLERCAEVGEALAEGMAMGVF